MINQPDPDDEVRAHVRRTMQANKGRDTGPELAIRSILHARGMRFRVQVPLDFDRRRRCDILFSKVGLFVFVDGCFWHGCPDHFVQPKTRADFWATKIQRNRERDLETTRFLEDSGATVVRVWEHLDPSVAADRVELVYRALDHAHWGRPQRQSDGRSRS